MPWILSTTDTPYRTEGDALAAARKMRELAGTTEDRDPATGTTYFYLGGDLMASVYEAPDARSQS
jgi:hypothetical protein